MVVNIENIQNLLAKSIAELSDRFLDPERPVPEGLLEALEGDPRNGARRLAILIRLTTCLISTDYFRKNKAFLPLKPRFG